ncbi:ABC transporter permease [Halobiforma nitratireducens]|uniref:Binding-protein-dependent transport system inner membrane protein n=1 Tax=Halobiforma nitratireducens JCM 10879 TaxID=1227454 RepID=M0M1B9_9EURY|nr:ABC transporter permease [Halobiforma nitratireducens]EMA39471.1 binding-protein-dependent transport system inner membrane protein [Halobiforma nitratireducens JCM 10879]
MRDTDDTRRFERVDWDEIERSSGVATPPRIAFVLGVVTLAGLYALETSRTVSLGWQLERIDWVIGLGLVVLTSFLVVPAVRRPDITRRVLTRLVSRPIHAVGVGVFAVISLVGIVGPVVLSAPDLAFEHRLHSPYGFTSEAGWHAECLGEIHEGEGITRYCDGSLTYPLGTNHRGHPMGYLVVEGARIALYVLVFTAAFIVPLAAIVGVVAGFRGGRIDDLLTSYVDVQLCIPAIVAFFIGYMYWNVSLLLLLVMFGLLSWGGIARLVRSETLQRREDGHVLVARSLGASPVYIAKRHIVPNITNTLVPAVFHLLALLVLVEAGVAFLGFHHIELYSWGSTIQEGLDPPVTGVGLSMNPHEIWWVSTFPAIALTATLASLKLVGDGLRDALDPRQNP